MEKGGNWSFLFLKKKILFCNLLAEMFFDMWTL